MLDEEGEKKLNETISSVGIPKGRIEPNSSTCAYFADRLEEIIFIEIIYSLNGEED
jgi:hypothetical protein